MPPDSSERELIARVVAGEPGARDEFVSRYWRFVEAVIRRAVARHPSAVEEVPQEVFVRLFENRCRRLRQWRGDGDFASWLGPVVRSAMFDFMHDRYGRRPEQFPAPRGDPDYPWDPPDPGATAEDVFGEQERARILERLMLRLSVSDRHLLTTHLLHETPAHVIARDLGIEVNAVYQRVHRALRRLERLARAQHPDLFPEGGPVRPATSEPSLE